MLVAVFALVRGRIAVVDGAVEASGPVIAWALRHAVLLRGGVAALTLGHVVLGRDERVLAATRAHERVHVAQYERWGPLFLPAYLLAGLWAALRGRHPYHDNPFERDAVDNAIIALVNSRDRPADKPRPALRRRRSYGNSRSNPAGGGA